MNRIIFRWLRSCQSLIAGSCMKEQNFWFCARVQNKDRSIHPFLRCFDLLRVPVSLTKLTPKTGHDVYRQREKEEGDGGREARHKARRSVAPILVWQYPQSTSESYTVTWIQGSQMGSFNIT